MTRRTIATAALLLGACGGDGAGALQEITTGLGLVVIPREGFLIILICQFKNDFIHEFQFILLALISTI